MPIFYTQENLLSFILRLVLLLFRFPLIVAVNIGNNLLPRDLPLLKLLVADGRNSSFKIDLIGALMPEGLPGYMIIKFPMRYRCLNDNGLIKKCAGKSPSPTFSADRFPQRPLLLNRTQLTPGFSGSDTLEGCCFAAV